MNILEKNYEEHLYSRGFLVTSDLQENLTNLKWSHYRKGKLNIYLHPKTEYAFCNRQGYWTCIIGHCIDTVNNTVDLGDISHILFEKILRSDEEFYSYIERLSGRYVIITQMKNGLNVLNDATGMQSVFYHQYKSVFGSHANLVAETTNEGSNPIINIEWLKSPKTYHLPGHFTPYNNIVFLLPNHFRNFDENKTERYFPRKELLEENINEVIDILVEETEKQMNLISKSNKMLFSITGGMDSRSSLALSKKYKDSIHFFTYYYMHSLDSNFKGNKSLHLDRAIVKSIAENLSLNHKFVPIDYAMAMDKAHQQFVKVLRKNTFLNHNTLLAKLYLDNYGDDNYLHLRSNIQEITRITFRNLYKFTSKTASFSDIVTCTNSELLKDDLAVKSFKIWLDNYNPNIGMNYDPFDLLYWESRMGTWHSQLLIQSDPAFNTHILINSQYLLRKLLSIPNDKRQNDFHLEQIVNSEWPVLSYWKVNENKTLREENAELKKNISQINSGIKDFRINYSAGNLSNNEKVPYKMLIDRDREIFYINKSAPNKNDFAKADIAIIKEDPTKDYFVCLEIRSPYQRRKNIGRLKYQIYLNDELLLEEDVAKWDQTNQIYIPINRTMPERSRLTIQITSIKDCESWNWGKAGRIYIENIEVVEKPVEVEPKIRYSSPYSVVIRNALGI